VTPEEQLYYEATGTLPGDVQAPAVELAGAVHPSYSVRGAENGVLDDEDVLAVIREFAGEEALDTFPLRYEPVNGAADDRVLIRPVPCPDGRYLAVSFRFGHEDPDEMISWKPEWLGVDGPFTREELEAFGRERR
jgi:hypothetical protein